MFKLKNSLETNVSTFSIYNMWLRELDNKGARAKNLAQAIQKKI